MRKKKSALVREGGWTLVEALLSVVVMAIMILGLTVVLMAFREQLDRSWSIRAMDQYGNDVIEQLTHKLRNATDVDVRGGVGLTSKIDIKFLDPYVHDLYHTESWRADLRTCRITVNNRPLDNTFPPRRMGRGESYEILQFTMTPFGTLTPNQWEHQDAFSRNANFNGACYDLRFKLRYNKRAIAAGQHNWSYEKEYYNRVYMRNKNLIVKKGITQ